MADFFNLNLWMFIVIGVFGFALCWFRRSMVWWILPVTISIGIAYIVSAPTQSDEVPQEYGILTLVRLAFSMFVAIGGPILGASFGQARQNPRNGDLP